MTYDNWGPVRPRVGGPATQIWLRP